MEYLDLIKQLIRIKSYSGEEEKLRDFITKWFVAKGIKSFKQDQNLIAFIPGKDKTKAFIFNSHMDTVSTGEMADWKHNPFEPTEKDGKLYGLGASDMKSGLASAMLTAVEYVGKNRPLVDIWFTFVVKEEVDGSGSESFAKWFKAKGYTNKYKDLAGIFTEPTGLKEIEHGHRGNLFLIAESKGDSGHSARPQLIKKHSVEAMLKFGELLEKEFKYLPKSYLMKGFNPPSVGKFTSIWAGVRGLQKGGVEPESANKFPAKCQATFDIRTTPTFHDCAYQLVKKIAKKTGVKVSLLYPAAQAGYVDPQEKIIREAKKEIKGLKLTLSQGSADLGFITSIGVKAIIFGPGEKKQAHQVNEYCNPKQIPQAVMFYKAILEAWSK